MKRISNGQIVPKHQMEFFTGKTASAFGVFDCVLTYTPKSINHIMCAQPMNLAGAPRMYKMMSLVGNTLTIDVYKRIYDKVNTPTGTTDAAGGGAVAEPHGHAITTTSTDVGVISVTNEDQGTVVLNYDI